MEAWKRYLKRENKKEQYFRNFGDLSGDSVVTDIYKKRKKKVKRYYEKK